MFSRTFAPGGLMARRLVTGFVGAGVIGAGLVVGGCGSPQTPQQRTATFSVTFIAEADPGVPLAGVVVKANGREVGRSDEFGLVQTMLRGPEGAGVEIAHECPDGHVQPRESQTLRLHDFRSLDGDGRSGLDLTLSCTPARRRVAFVVRTNGHADIPIKVNGQEVARTNAQGFAYVVQAAEPGRTFRMTLDTSELPKLRPQNPYQQFTLGPRDDVFVFAQTFEVEEPRPVRRRARRRPEPIRIIRLN
ncbi:MAG: hypothetical protein KF901_24050 [Myxococcales bacterium]|nr:hypothetical protein [Myxococcales bacterium]